METTIANATLFDVAAVYRLERLCFGEADAYDWLTLIGMFLTPGMIRLKALRDSKIVGFLASEIEMNTRIGWVITVGVLPEYWGRGVGSALLHEVEQKLRTRTRRIQLTVRRTNARAIALYERTGYKWINTFRGYYRDGEDGLVMEKTV